MKTSNHDIQAGHMLLSIFERSKIHLDEILDQQPGLFAIVDLKGRILRCNSDVADLFQLTIGQCLGRSFSELFSDKTWTLFSRHLEKTSKLKSGSETFELQVKAKAHNTAIPVFWRIESLSIAEKSELKLAVVLGQDISLLRRAERQLSEVFATIPVGILTVDEKGIIGPSYSAYCESLLDTTNIGGKKALDVVFSHCFPEDGMDSKLLQLFNSLGSSVPNLGDLTAELPKELEYRAPGSLQKKWIALTYHPIEIDSRFQKLLLTLEDHTQAVELRRLQEQAKELSESATVRFLQVKRSKYQLVRLLLEDFSNIFQQLDAGVQLKSPSQIKRALHSVKGNAMIMDFTLLSDLAHELETLLQDKSDVTPALEQQIESYHQKINSEWQSYKDLIQVLHKTDGETVAKSSGEMLELINRRYRESLSSAQSPLARKRLELALRTLNSSALSELEPKLQEHANKLSGQLNKQVDVTCSWNESHVHEDLRSTLSDSFIHLLNNSLVHGIEPPDQRKIAGKGLKGVIGFDCFISSDRLKCVVWDDGRGVDVERVKRKALKSKLVSIGEISKMSNSEILNLIFSQGLSTSEKVDLTSGRGVGLDAVKACIEAAGGQIHVENRFPAGTLFKIDLPLNRRPVEKDFFLLSQLLAEVDAELKSLSAVFGFEFLGQDDIELGQEDYFFYGDRERLAVMLSTFIAEEAAAYKVQLKVSLLPGRIQFDLQKLEPRSPIELPVEFAASRPACDAICFMHKGEITRCANSVRVHFEQLIETEQIPEFDIVPDASLSFEEGLEAFSRVSDLAKSLGLEVALKSEKDLRPESFCVYLVRENPKNRPHTIVACTSDETLKDQFVECVRALLK